MTSLVLERDHLARDLRNTDAESMISGFRRVLEGVCDGGVLLDDGLRIQEGSHGLKRILSNCESFDKKLFQDLLSPNAEELERFAEFISETTLAGQSVAPCLRLSMQSPGGRLGVDAYHVALPHLYGSEGMYHLLALKRDVEERAIPEA